MFKWFRKKKQESSDWQWHCAMLGAVQELHRYENNKPYIILKDMETTTPIVEVTPNASLEERKVDIEEGKMLIDGQRARIETIDCLRRLMESTIPDEGKTYGEGIYKTLLADKQMDTVWEKIIELIEQF